LGVFGVSGFVVVVSLMTILVTLAPAEVGLLRAVRKSSSVVGYGVAGVKICPMRQSLRVMCRVIWNMMETWENNYGVVAGMEKVTLWLAGI
jgi:hypothetical protein